MTSFVDKLANPPKVQVNALIQIVVLPNGMIQCQVQGCDRNLFNMMIERAKQDIIPKFIEQEKAQAGEAIEIAPLGMKVAKNGD